MIGCVGCLLKSWSSFSSRYLSLIVSVYVPALTGTVDMFLELLCDFGCEYDYCLCLDNSDDSTSIAPCDYSLIRTLASLEAIDSDASDYTP
jgi:hypothetical protein